MAGVTEFSLLALFSRPHTFTPKSAGTGGKSSAQVTEFNLLALFGPIRTFVAKTSPTEVRGPGQITQFNLMGLFGPIRTFAFKIPHPPLTEPPRKQKLHGWNRHRLLKWGGKFKPYR